MITAYTNPETVGEYSTKELQRYFQPLSCAIDGRFKLIRRADSDDVVDLTLSHPDGETIGNPKDPDQARLTRLRIALDNAESEAARSPARVTPPSVPIEEETALIEQMKSLGYL
jgi:hypothetical protein